MSWATPVLEERSPFRCCACGEVVINGDGWYVFVAGKPVIDDQHLAHTRCVDWSTRPFPFPGVAEDLRRCRYSVEPRHRAAWLALSRRLVLLLRPWPDGAVDILAGVRALLVDARELAARTELPERHRWRVW